MTPTFAATDVLHARLIHTTANRLARAHGLRRLEWHFDDLPAPEQLHLIAVAGELRKCLGPRFAIATDLTEQDLWAAERMVGRWAFVQGARYEQERDQLTKRTALLREARIASDAQEVSGD